MAAWPILAILIGAAFPTEAWAAAANLQCTASGGVVASTSLFGVFNCDSFGPANVFSGLNCQFMAVLNQVMSTMYCGLQSRLETTLAVVMVLYVLVYAIAFTFGITELTAKELVTRLVKMALIWSFAMNASWGVGLTFNALVGSMEMASTWLISAIQGGQSSATIFQFLDQLLYNQISGMFSRNNALLLGFILSLSFFLFPLFCLFAYLFMKVMGILIRTLISYLMAATLISFLIALGPIFVSFALFKVTRHLFETWLSYLISYALQIVLVFAAVAMWVLIMSQFADFFTNLLGVLRYNDRVQMLGAHIDRVKYAVGVCESTAVYQFPVGYRLQCLGNNRVVPASAFVQYPAFIWFLFSNLISLCVIVYAFDRLIAQMPEVAQKLAGPADSPKLFGNQQGQLGINSSMFGVGKLQQAQSNFLKAGLGGIADKIRPVRSTVIDNFKEQAEKLNQR